jgi:PhnB protein
MLSLNPYLTLPGKAREAIQFYADVFGGEVIALMTFGEMDPNAGEMANMVMHSHMKADSVEIMISEGGPGDTRTGNGPVDLALHMEDTSLQERLYNALAEGGEIRMPLGDVPWGARYGEVVDKYGIRWLLNCQTEGAPM